MFDLCWGLFEYQNRMANSASKLEPFRDFIAAERRKKTTYRRIAELLAEQGLQVDFSTIHAFVRVRSKPRRRVITMLESSEGEPSSPTKISHAATEPPRRKETAEAQPEHSGQFDAILRLKQSRPAETGSEGGLPSYREGQPLERLSAEEARRLREGL